MSITPGLPTNLPTTAEGRIDTDIACVQCEYNLRSQYADAECPECGLPIIESTRARQLRFADPAWLRTLQRGLIWLIAGWLLTALHWPGLMLALRWMLRRLPEWPPESFYIFPVAVLMAAVMSTWIRRDRAHQRDVWILFAVFLGAMAFGVVNQGLHRAGSIWYWAPALTFKTIVYVGWWWITTRETGVAVSRHTWFPRRVARIAWVVILIEAGSLEFHRSFSGWPDPMSLAMTVFFQLSTIVANVASLSHLAALARRLPAPQLVRHCLIALGIAVTATVGTLIHWLVIMDYSGRGTLNSPTLVLQVTNIVAPLLYFVSMIWQLVVFIWFYRRLRPFLVAV